MTHQSQPHSGTDTGAAGPENDEAPQSRTFEDESNDEEILSFAPSRLRVVLPGWDTSPPSSRMDSPPSFRPRTMSPPSLDPRSVRVVLPPTPGLPDIPFAVEEYARPPSEPFFEAAIERYREDLWFRFERAVRQTQSALRHRTLVSHTTAEAGRFFAQAEGLERLLATPLVAAYLSEDGVAEGLLGHLDRIKETPRDELSELEHGDMLLRARVTAIRLAPCVGYWRARAEVPARIKAMLTPDAVYGSVLEVARARKSKVVETFLRSYTELVSGLERERPELNVRPRNPILWPWCRHAIEQVTYAFHAPDEAHVEPAIVDAYTDVKLLQVLFNVFVDDAADNVQDPALVDVLSRIPTASGRFGDAAAADHDRLRGELMSLDRPEFVPYFDLAVEVWNHTLGRLRELSGESFGRLAGRLAHDYARIMDSMRLSVDLNTRTAETLRRSGPELSRAYGDGDLGTVLAHNSNRRGFYTVDLMCAREHARHAHDTIDRSHGFEVYETLATAFQEMHQIGNSVATGAREVDSDDVSSELIKLANHRLNESSGWVVPPHIADLFGRDERRDLLLRALGAKKEARRRKALARFGSDEHCAASDTAANLMGEIEELIEESACEGQYFEAWLSRRATAARALEQAEIPDGERLLAGNDLLLVMHLVYKGRI